MPCIHLVLKFKRKIFGIWPQTDRQTYLHTHMHNAVTLVWGSLRLAPIMYNDT